MKPKRGRTKRRKQEPTAIAESLPGVRSSEGIFGFVWVGCGVVVLVVDVLVVEVVVVVGICFAISLRRYDFISLTSLRLAQSHESDGLTPCIVPVLTSWTF